jgi:hypothetical protein
MTGKDDWMVGLGVNVPQIKVGLGNVNLFPTSLQNIANAPPAPQKKPQPPPKDALARAGDRRPFWRPAAPDANPKPVVDKDWITDFLRFYRAGPPNPPDPDGMTCSFNGATMKIADALEVVDRQANLNGYRESRPLAGGVLQDVMREVAKGTAVGDQVAKDPNFDVDKLAALPMPQLLAALDRLKAQNKLEDFVDKRLTDRVSPRLGAAINTVRGQFEDIQWQTDIQKLNDEDRAAVLARAPAKVRPIKPGPARKDEKPEDPVEVEGVIAASKDGVEVQVKITAHSPLGSKLGETEGTVHIGPGGKITQLELDVTAFQASLTGKGSVADVTITVSGNATVDLDRSGTRIAADGLNAQVKTELAAKLTRVKVLSGVTVKLTGTYGTAGGAVTGGLEFEIPGS